MKLTRPFGHRSRPQVARLRFLDLDLIGYLADLWGKCLAISQGRPTSVALEDYVVRAPRSVPADDQRGGRRHIRIPDRATRRDEHMHGENFDDIEQPELRAAFLRALGEVKTGRKSLRMLDYGCGSGNLTPHPLTRGASVAVVDVTRAVFALFFRARYENVSLSFLRVSAKGPGRDADDTFDQIGTYSVIIISIPIVYYALANIRDKGHGDRSILRWRDCQAHQPQATGRAVAQFDRERARDQRCAEPYRDAGRNCVGSPLKASKETGFTAEVDLREEIKRLVDWRAAHRVEVDAHRPLAVAEI